MKYTIEVTLPDGSKETVEVDSPNQRDAHLLAKRHVTGSMDPPDLDTRIILPRALAGGRVIEA